MRKELQRRQANIAAGFRYDGRPRVLKRWPQLRGLSPQEQNNFHTQQWRERNKAGGRTVLGTDRKYYSWPELAHLTGRARMNERIRICTNRYRQLRRQATGKDRPPKQSVARLVGWREGLVNSLILVAEIEAAVTAINAVYEKLDPSAKAKSLELAHTLAGIRMKLSRV